MRANGIQWIEARVASEYPETHRTAPSQKNLWFKMSEVLRLRNPVLNDSNIAKSQFSN